MDFAVGEVAGEVVAVDVGVVAGAEQGEVVGVGWAVVGVPFAEVVGFAPGGGSVAAGVGAAVVAQAEVADLVGAGEAGGAFVGRRAFWLALRRRGVRRGSFFLHTRRP